MRMVDTVGVRKRGWIFANDLGSAPYTAMDRVVRAVGRIVVCVDAAAEDSTIRISRRDRNVPKPEVPKTAPPRMDSTSPVLAELPRPMPLVPMPANDCTEVVTSREMIS